MKQSHPTRRHVRASSPASRSSILCRAAQATAERLEARTLFAQMLFQVDVSQSVIGLSAEAFNIGVDPQGTNSLRAMYQGSFVADVDGDSVQFVAPDSTGAVDGEDPVGVIRALMKNSYDPGNEPANYAGEVERRILGAKVGGKLAVRDLALTISSGELPITTDNRFSTGPSTIAVVDGRLDYETDFGDGTEDLDGNDVENDGGAATIAVVNGVTTLTIPVKVKYEYGSGIAKAELTLSGKIVATSAGDLPLADLNGNAGPGFDNAVTYSVGVDATVDVAADDATILDSDSASLAGATVTLTNPLDGAAAETLAVTTAGTGIVGNYDTATGVLSLSGAGTVGEYQQVLRTITYANDAASPTGGDRAIAVVLNDGQQLGPVSTSVVSVFDPNEVGLGADAGVRSVVYTDPDGTVTKITLAGPGSARLDVSGATAQNLSRGRLLIEGSVTVNGVTLTDTTPASKLVIAAGRTGDGRVTVGGVAAAGGLATVGAKNVDLTGNVTVGGLLKSVVFGNVSGATISAGSIGAVTVHGTLAGSTITATDAQLDTPTIRSIVVRGETTGSTVITPGRITKVTAFGMSNTNVTAGSIGAFTVVGALADSNVTTTGPLEATPSLRAMTVRGAITGTVVTTAGNITSVVAFGMVDSAIYVGRSGTDGFPDDATDLPTEATLGTVAIKRLRGTTGPLFGNSVIAANNVRKATLGELDTANAGTGFGLAADAIGVLIATNEAGQTLRVRGLDDPATADATLAATGFAFGDMEVRVF